MRKFNILPADLTKESIDDVFWANMKAADQWMELPIMLASAIGWVSQDETRNFRTLELEFRKRDFETHIIAKMPTNVKTAHLLKLHDSVQRYECFFSCCPRKLALKELLTHAKSYEENLARLINTGFFTTEDNEIVPDAVFTDSQKDVMKRLENGLARIEIKYLPFEQFISDLKKQHPTMKQTLIFNDEESGTSFYGFSVKDAKTGEDSFISDTGTMLTPDDEAQTMVNLPFSLSAFLNSIAKKEKKQ
jgi:hypothetical protein